MILLVLIVSSISLTACRYESRIVVFGSGSTFVEPALIKWIRDFEKINGNVEINYIGGGSGKGQQDILSRKADFSCSDPPLRKDAWTSYKGEILQFPIVIGAIIITYNIPEIGKASLNLSGPILAKIYMGEIKYWDNPLIKEANPSVAKYLPHAPIIAVHRSDASGTTQIFTQFLYKSTNGYWPKRLVGKIIDWPVDKNGRGLGEQGNPGVVNAIIKTKYSLGYVEWAYALSHKLPIAKIRNPYGVFVYPNKESVEAAFNVPSPPDVTDDWTHFTYTVIYSNTSRYAYPLVGQTFMIIWKNQSSPDKCDVLREFLKYIAGPGQENIMNGYAPLPDSLRKRIIEASNLLSCSG